MEHTSPFQMTPWVKRLIAANVVVYVLAATVFTGPWFTELFAFGPFDVAHRPWTPLTYMFVHAGILHLAFNALMLFFFGPPVEREMGGTAFLRFYVLCGLGAPALAFAMSLGFDVAPFVGASAAVFGVALAFALRWPGARVFIFPLPFPVPVRLLVGLLVFLNLVPLVFGAPDGVAHLAHLGGLVFGLIYLKGEQWFAAAAAPPAAASPPVRVLVPQRTDAAGADDDREEPAVAADPPAPSSDDVHDEVDRVLDKISEQGLGSLTPAERRFLDDISRRLRQP